MRKLTTKANKPAAAKPAAKPAKQASANVAAPVIVTAPEATVTEAAKPSARIARTAATIVRQATNFGGLSDRDTAYLAFYASFAKAASNGVVTLSAIVESGRKPAYNGSAKPHDAGVIVRLTKAGLIVPTDAGHNFTFTAKAKTLAAYTAS